MRAIIILSAGAFIGALAAWLCWAFIPPADEVSPHLDAGVAGGGDGPCPTPCVSADFFESTIVIRSPWQFNSDADNGDWLFSEEWEDGTTHRVRVHFTTVSAQSSVTTWAYDALLAKTDAFLRGWE